MADLHLLGYPEHDDSGHSDMFTWCKLVKWLSISTSLRRRCKTTNSGMPHMTLSQCTPFSKTSCSEAMTLQQGFGGTGVGSNEGYKKMAKSRAHLCCILTITLYTQRNLIIIPITLFSL